MLKFLWLCNHRIYVLHICVHTCATCTSASCEPPWGDLLCESVVVCLYTVA